MDRYLCQLCNTIVTYGENHPCFFYKDNEHTTPELNESEELDRIVDETKEKLETNLKDETGKLYSADQQIFNAEFEQINLMLSETKKNVSFVPAPKRKRKFSSTFNEPSNDEQYEKFPDKLLSNTILSVSETKIHTNESASCKASSENIDPNNRYESGIHGVPLFRAASNEGCENSLGDRKWQSYCGNINMKHSLMESLQNSTKDVRLDTKNKSVIPNFQASFSVSPIAEKFAKVLFEVSKGQTYFSMSHEMASQVPCRSADTIANESSNLRQDDNAVAGPSCISQHILRNAEEKKYQCDRCPLKYKKKLHLDIHYRTHTGEKPFLCELCGKFFVRKSTLKEHTLLHTGEKPYVCDVCKRRFADRSNRNKHARTHTGENP